MRKIIAIISLVGVSMGSFIFDDIRPASYPKQRTLDIHVGRLTSGIALKTHDFYFLNYCMSTGTHHYAYSDDGAIQDNFNSQSSIRGVSMYDTSLHETFF